jgi:hypothetical protein
MSKADTEENVFLQTAHSLLAMLQTFLKMYVQQTGKSTRSPTIAKI